MKHSYQLTKHPIGSLKEIWSLSWPLMLAMMSTAIMIFTDRLLMSWESPLGFSAVATAGMVYFLFIIIPMWISNASEVLVGRLNGADEKKEAGLPVWQLIRANLVIFPVFVFIGYFLSPYIFYNSGNEENEITYFSTLIYFATIHCSQIVLSGFFIGIGQTTIITISMILGNVLNGFLAYLLIFGYGPIPAMGIQGAALGSGLSQTLQFLLLLCIFLRKKNRQTYGTSRLKFCPSYLWEGLRIGIPGGCGHAIEIFAHCAFLRIVMKSGIDQILIVTAVQSLFLAIGFINDAISKAVSSLVSNLIGAKRFDLIPKVFFSSVKLILIFFSCIFTIFVLFNKQMLAIFFTGEASHFLMNPVFVSTAVQALICMTFFFLFDGLNWVLVGHMNASGDTKYILYVNSIVNWLFYVLPVYIAMTIFGYGADTAWMITALYSSIAFALYLWRYKSGRWLQDYLQRNKEIIAA